MKLKSHKYTYDSSSPPISRFISTELKVTQTYLAGGVFVYGCTLLALLSKTDDCGLFCCVGVPGDNLPASVSRECNISLIPVAIRPMWTQKSLALDWHLT